MTPGDMISQYNKIKATRLILEAEHKAAIAPYKEAEETIENALLEYLNSNGLQNLNCPDGTAYKTTQTFTKLTDRVALLQHCQETGNYDYFTNALAKETVKEFVATHKHLPPGVELTERITVNIRKGK